MLRKWVSQRGGVGAIALIATSLGSQAIAQEPPNELFTSLDETRLFEGVGLTKTSNTDAVSGLTLTGIVYSQLQGRKGRPQVSSIEVAVHESIAAAQDGMKEICFRPTPPRFKHVAPTVGDERYIWVDHEERWRAFPFRRGNITVSFGGMGKFEDAHELALQLDKLIQNDRDVAPIGQFTEQPQIASLGLPPILVARKDYEASPELRGLGPKENVEVCVAYNGPISRSENAKLIINSPGKLVSGPDLKLFEQSGVVKCRVVAANEQNVFVTRTFDINVVMEP